MIICHHHSGPRHVEYPVRQACEFLGQVLSWQLATRVQAELAEESAQAQKLVGALVEKLAASAQSLTSVLIQQSETVLALTGARGAVVSLGGQTQVVGLTPPKADLDALVKALEPRLGDRPFATDSIATLLPDAHDLEPIASGVLAIGLGGKASDGYVIWLRPEMLQTVRWVGDPRKLGHLREPPVRLSPEGSFMLWSETVRGRALRWNQSEIDAAAALQRALRGSLAARAVEMTKLADELRIANHTKDEFLALISHELRTPLSAMLGWTRLLRENRMPEDKRAHALEVIERNGQAQAKIIEDLLDVSRIISGKLRLDVQTVQPVDFVQAAVEAVRPSADAKGIQLLLTIDPLAGPLMGDPARMQQVAWNLLSNAIKFTPKGGKVRVVLERVHSYVDLTVTDNGEGIPADMLPHVFERFRQADGSRTRKHKGLGLGLSIVRHLVELHGGTVVVRSDGEGKGSPFTVRLPVTPVHRQMAVAGASEERPELPAPPSLARLRVLIVDDEPDARELLREILERAGMNPETADSARAALAAFDASPPDLLISDIGMPEVDGYSLIEEIRRRPAAGGGQIPAVALTAYSRTEDRARALLAGYEAHVPKPIDAFELLAVLTSVSRRIARPNA
jgi:light-regulated signal transduction histidine kinase (bacteriophytochrome)/ActR/RegA family two-component response regulator